MAGCPTLNFSNGWDADIPAPFDYRKWQHCLAQLARIRPNSVRFRIRQMIDQESASQILSDDAIVVRLKEANIDIARRTVAKYRESLKIPSSVQRRREKATS
jgi:hypothetical protein